MRLYGRRDSISPVKVILLSSKEYKIHEARRRVKKKEYGCDFMAKALTWQKESYVYVLILYKFGIINQWIKN